MGKQRIEIDKWLLTPEEAAARLRVSIRTLQEMRTAGTGPQTVKVGGRVLYPIVALQVWIIRQCQERHNHE